MFWRIFANTAEHRAHLRPSSCPVYKVRKIATSNGAISDLYAEKPSSRFAAQTRENSPSLCLARTTIRLSASLARVVSHHREREEVLQKMPASVVVLAGRAARDFGTNITCRDKATCLRVAETRGSTYNEKVFSGRLNTSRITFRGFNLPSYV